MHLFVCLSVVRGGAGGGEEDEDVSVSVRNVMREGGRIGWMLLLLQELELEEEEQEQGEEQGEEQEDQCKQLVSSSLIFQQLLVFFVVHASGICDVTSGYISCC